MGNEIPTECGGENCITCCKRLEGIPSFDKKYFDHTALLYTFTPDGAERYFRRQGQDYYQCECCFKDPDWEEKRDRDKVIVDHDIQPTGSLHRLKLHSRGSKQDETDSIQRWVTLIQEAGDALNKEAVSELLIGLCRYPELFRKLTADQIDSFSSVLGGLLEDWGHTYPPDVPIEVFHWVHVFLVEQYFDYNQFDMSAVEKSHVHEVLASMFNSVVEIQQLVKMTTYAHHIIDTYPILENEESLCVADNVAAGFIHLLLTERFSGTAVDEAPSPSEWPQTACMALVNILIEPPQKEKYNYRQALSKLINGEIWKPMEVVDLLPSIQKYMKSDDNSLSTTIEQLISSQSGSTLGAGTTSLIDILNKEGPLGLLLRIYENEDQNVEKNIDILCKEIEENGMVDKTVLFKAKSVAHSVLRKLEERGLSPFDDIIPYDDKSHHTSSDDGDYSSTLVQLCCVIKQCNCYWPRATQILSCALLCIAEEGHGRLLEIATGKGKSCIIAMFAAVLAQFGKTVDIVTSSHVLAARDCNEWRKFYELCGLSVSHNGHAANDEERQKCYKANIVYGTVGSFAADILRQDFHLRQTRGSRDIEMSAVIADEVDFMLLDRGVQFTYLSDKSLGLCHIEPIFATIWTIVSRFTPIRVEGELYFHERPQPFHKGMQSVIGIDPRVSTDEIREIAHSAGIFEKFPKTIEQVQSDDWLSNISSGEMVKFFQAAKDVLQESLEIYEMQEVDGKFAPVKVITSFDDPPKDNCPTSILVLEKGLCLVLCKGKSDLQTGIANTVKYYTSPNSNPHINVPLYLQDLVEYMIPVWVESAFQATHMTRDREYHIRDGKVLPVDFGSTGVIETNKKWGDGLQQFVELKHHLQISETALVTNYMSNLEFFKRYGNRLYGVTGTLGSEADKCFLKRQFGVDLCHVPMHMKTKLYEDTGRVLQNEAEWLSAITEEVMTEVKKVKWRKGARAALVICEDIISAEKVASELRGKVPGQLHVYTGKGKSTILLPELLSPGDVIVATNLAGRGTDIKASYEVNTAGGLFVVLSFLPPNTRVEMQAFGRTGRKGQPGSSKLLVNYKRLPLVLRKNAGSVRGLKMINEVLEKDKLDIMMHSEVVYCSVKEELFREYCIHFKRVTESFKDMADRDKELAIMLLHDQWGLWLQMKSDGIRGMVSNPKSSLESELDSLKSSLRRMIDDAMQNIQDTCSKNIYYIIRSGNNLMLNSNFNQATECYDKAVELDPTWASIALHNKAYCTIKLKKGNYKDAAMSDLKECLKKLENYKEELQITATSVHCFSSRADLRNSNDSKTDLHRYIEMKQHALYLFEKNVQQSLKMLESLTGDDDAEASLEPIIPDVHVDEMEKQELKELGFQGLAWFFSLKKIRHFCWSGLLVAFMGIAQMAAGIFLSAVTAGTLAEVGMALVIEGCADIYAGIKGMYTGEFDWKSWAVGKAMSIVITVVTFGIGTYIKAGARGLASALQEVGPGLREIPSLVRSQFGKEALEGTVKSACKEAGAELVEQGVIEVIGIAEDATIEHLMVTIENEIMASIKKDMVDDAISGKISKSIDLVTKSTLSDKREIDDIMYYQIKQQFKSTANSITSNYIDSSEWQECVQQLAGGVAERLHHANPTNTTLSIVRVSIQVFNIGEGLVEAETRTKQLQEEFKSELNSCLHDILGIPEVSDADDNVASESKERYSRLKRDIGEDLAKILSKGIQEIWRKFFVGNVTSEICKKFNSHVAEKTGTLIGRHKIKESLEVGVSALHTASMPPDHIKSSTSIRDVVQHHKLALSKGDEMASVMEARILSERLGKRIEIVDENGKPLLTVGTNQTNDAITVVYQKPTEHSEQGHYNAVVNGKLIKLENEGNDCLFHAVSLANGGSQENVEKDSRHLKDLAARELDENPEKWGHLITRTNHARALSETLMMVGGGAKKIVNKAKRGKALIYKTIGKRESKVQADHQPASLGLKLAMETNCNNDLANKLRTITKWDGRYIKNGELPAIISCTCDHRYVVTTNNTHESKAAAQYTADRIVRGDVEGMVKAGILAGSVDFATSVYAGNNKKIHKPDPGYQPQSDTAYKEQNVNLLKSWRELLGNEVMSDQHYKNLEKWVNQEGYKKPNDSTRNALLEKCRDAIHRAA